MTRRIGVWIPGIPIAQGSKRIVRGRLIDVDSRLHRWRTDSALIVREAARGHHWPRSMPVAVWADFRLPKPAQPAHSYPCRPDLDKLTRALCDALTISGVIADDSQIVRIVAVKNYAIAAHVGVQLAIRCQVD